MAEFSLQALADEVESRLDPKKFLHVLGVTHAACALALRHGVDPWRAAVAGLLHDYSKRVAPAEIEADLIERGHAIPEDDRPYPGLWHGLHASVIAGEHCGLTEQQGLKEIAEAVRFHSTAEAGIGPLARILFVADYTEPGRSFEGIDELREAARRDLDEGFKKALERKCRYMQRKDIGLSPRARRALNACGADA